MKNLETKMEVIKKHNLYCRLTYKLNTKIGYVLFFLIYYFGNPTFLFIAIPIVPGPA